MRSSRSTHPYVFFFGDFNVHHKDWLIYSGGTVRPGELCFNFSISNDLTQMVNFPAGSLAVTLTILLFWIYFFISFGIDVYIPHRKYQVKLHFSPWFSAACASAIAQRNHFFVCTKKINLLNLK